MSHLSGYRWKQMMHINRQDVLLKYKNLNDKIADVNLIKDQNRYKQTIQELKELEPIVLVIEEIQKNKAKIADLNALLKSETDKELIELIKTEKEIFEADQKQLEDKLKHLLLPKDINDNKNVILEIRAGTGGDEAAIFVADLFRMYQKYAEAKKYRFEILNFNEINGGAGMKEVITLISGSNVYANLKHETGAHRVQRIPETESSGRIHTSAVTVAVLPEVEEKDFHLEEKDLKIDTYRAGGAGGQHVNTTDSAVRITHIPSGTVVTCQDERSQQKNKLKAMKVLRARIAETIREREVNHRAKERKGQVGSGDRSERIRTYNYPQSRVTDHRINKTIHKLDLFINGDLDDIIEPLKLKEKEDLLLQQQSQ